MSNITALTILKNIILGTIRLNTINKCDVKPKHERPKKSNNTYLASLVIPKDIIKAGIISFLYSLGKK
jgi:hypothetical protein